MVIEWHYDPISLDRIITIRLSKIEMEKAHLKMTGIQRDKVHQLSRNDSSFEEKLIALQIYAKVLDEETPKIS